MRIINTTNKTYQVDVCQFCKEDKIIYCPPDLPWSDEKWICSNCTSTYTIFNKDIAIELSEIRDNKLNELGIND